jgi:hypothetical protein
LGFFSRIGKYRKKAGKVIPPENENSPAGTILHGGGAF